MRESNSVYGRGWHTVPVQVTQGVLTHPTLSLAARGLYAVVCALKDDPQGAQAVLNGAPEEVLTALLAELAEAGYARRNGDGGFTVGEAGLATVPDVSVASSPRPEPSRSGWAYAIAESDRQLVKIGTTADVSRRLRGLQSSSPRKLHVLWQGAGGAALEAHLHDTFASRRVRGEWFDFSGVDAAALIAAAAQTFERAK